MNKLFGLIKRLIASAIIAVAIMVPTQGAMIFPFAGAAFTFDLSYVDETSSGTDGTTFTFSGRSFGAASDYRYIIVGVVAQRSSATVNFPSSVTIGGVSASSIVGASRNPSGSYTAQLWIAAVPTGTTGDVVVTYANSMQRCGITIWRMINDTATANTTGTDTAATTTDLAFTVSAAKAGVLVTVSAHSSAAPSITISGTGVTQDTNLLVESGGGNRLGSAHFDSTASSVTWTSTNGSGAAGAWASWG